MYEFKKQGVLKGLRAIFPGASTVSGMMASTDIGKLLMASSNNALLAIGSTADIARAAGILGILVGFEASSGGSTSASTSLVYYEPILPGEEITATFSTTFSTVIPATTDIGKYVGFSNTTTVAGAESLSIGTMGNVRGTTSGCFFKITAVDSTHRRITGTIDSSHLAL